MLTTAMLSSTAMYQDLQTKWRTTSKIYYSAKLLECLELQLLTKSHLRKTRSTNPRNTWIKMLGLLSDKQSHQTERMFLNLSRPSSKLLAYDEILYISHLAKIDRSRERWKPSSVTAKPAYEVAASSAA
jgi:hypothetical protein